MSDLMTSERLSEITKRFSERRIAVIGDFFLDKYLEFDPALAETSLETGKVANQVVSIRHSPGAAGTIVNNLVALGAKTWAIGFTGDDGEGYELRQDLTRLGCDVSHLSSCPDRHTPTYLKPRSTAISGLEGESERYDTKNRLPLPSSIEDRLIAALSDIAGIADAIIVADQVEEEGCGAITSRVRSAIEETAASHPEVVFWVDSRRRIGLFRNCIIKPNKQEAVNAIDPANGGLCDDMGALEAGEALQACTGKPVFLTASEQGIMVFDGGLVERVPAVRVDGPIDPTGAGDSATAGAAMALGSGASLAEAALIANLVASITVCQIGTTGTASVDDLPGRLEMWQGQRV